MTHADQATDGTKEQNKQIYKVILSQLTLVRLSLKKSGENICK